MRNLAVNREKAVKGLLTVAMVAVGAASVLAPEMTTHIAVGGTLVNLPWLWEA